MKRKILCSMLAVMTSICMLTACGNSSNPAEDTKSTDATESESMMQEEEKQTVEESDADGTTLSGDDQEAAAEDAERYQEMLLTVRMSFIFRLVCLRTGSTGFYQKRIWKKKIICIPVRSVSGRRIIRRISLCWDTRHRLVCVEPA